MEEKEKEEHLFKYLSKCRLIQKLGDLTPNNYHTLSKQNSTPQFNPLSNCSLIIKISPMDPIITPIIYKLSSYNRRTNSN